MKKTVSIILIFFIVASFLLTTGCGVNLDKNNNGNIGFNKFDDTFISFMKKSDLANENFVVSPLSFEFALALLAAGCNGNTQKEILDFLSYDSMDSFASRFAKFDEHIKYVSQFYEKTECDLKIANSIWKNNIISEKLKDSYKEYVNSHLGAEAFDVLSNEFASRVNNWVDENTNGLIKSILDESMANDLIIALINTLYFKSTWDEPFSEYNTKSDIFTTIDDKKVTKDFLNKKEHLKYYEDNDSKLVILDLHGASIAFVLGNSNNIKEKIDKAKMADVNVSIPKFDIETSLSDNQLIDFLRENGVNEMFESGDFTSMIENTGLCVSDIIQKSKISLDEYGVEAAAATMIAIKTSAVLIDLPEKEFIANEPFSYYVFSNVSNNSYLMFYGQLIK